MFLKTAADPQQLKRRSKKVPLIFTLTTANVQNFASQNQPSCKTVKAFANQTKQTLIYIEKVEKTVFSLVVGHYMVKKVGQRMERISVHLGDITEGRAGLSGK